LVSTGRPSEYTDAVTRGESLEHFHVFRREHAPTAAETLRLHSDVGLFIVMTAAENYETAAAEGRLQRLAGDTKPATGFLLELADGELVRPIIPDNSLLVMNGEGSSRWISGAAGAPRPRAASHEAQDGSIPPAGTPAPTPTSATRADANVMGSLAMGAFALFAILMD
ncbi:hypothetical protein FOA52_009250, partial [Chlamydomonas sp. UWO 241]